MSMTKKMWLLMQSDKNKIESEVEELIEELVSSFNQRRIEKIEELKLDNLIKRLNPYLCRAKNITTAKEMIRTVLNGHLALEEATLFGEVFERLVISLSKYIDGGRKSSTEGIDLEFDRGGVRYLISLKSGPNWGNSAQIKKMISSFQTAQRILRTQNPGINVIAINGCCYGKETKPEKEGYRKLCGQEFWTFLTGDDTFYINIIKPMGQCIKYHSKEYEHIFDERVDILAKEFIQRFCLPNGIIDWEKLLQYNSGSKKHEERK